MKLRKELSHKNTQSKNIAVKLNDIHDQKQRYTVIICLDLLQFKHHLVK